VLTPAESNEVDRVTAKLDTGDNYLVSSDSTWDDFFHGIRSLLDVFNFAAREYTVCCFNLHDLFVAGGLLDAVARNPELPEEPFSTANVLNEIDAGLDRVVVVCKKFGIDHSEKLGRFKTEIRAHPEPHVIQALITEVKHAILNQFKGRSCFILTTEETQMYNIGGSLSAKAGFAFPRSEDELGHAANCLALNEPHACVFHTMNALEEPLRAMARYFGIETETAMWGTIINGIKDKLDVISRKAKRGKRKTETLQFYGEAAKEFAYFNEAWRIYTMHGRASYDSHSARSIFDHVLHFTEQLGQRLSTRSKGKCRL
jgi:hypothetical protein